MTRTKGQAALARAFKVKRITQADVVQAVGASQSSVSTWSTGDGRPDAVQREALYRCFAIPVAWWLTEEERGRLGRMRRRVALVPMRHAAIVGSVDAGCKVSRRPIADVQRSQGSQRARSAVRP